MDFLQLVEKNRSYRGFDESAQVSRGQLERLVECARLCPSSVNMQPLKYYLSCDAETNARIQPLTGWARRLPEKNLPYPGHRPTAFIVICHDTLLAPNPERFYKDVGIVAQTILLGAVDMGLGGIMIGNFAPEKVRQALGLRETLVPVLILALGKPDETIVLEEAKDGETGYYRDADDVHHVPKRPLSELIV